MFSKERLKEKRIEKGFSQAQMAKQLEISRVAYHHWESGKTIPNQKHLATLALILEVEDTYFESEYQIVRDYLRLSPSNQQNAKEYVSDLLVTQQNQKIRPLFAVTVLSDVALSAGLGESLFDEYETETVYSDVEQHGYDIAAWIKGASMEPIYQNGEVALIKANGFDYDGAVYALSWNDTLYIKKLYREKEGFRMVSLNKDYPDQLIPYEDAPKIVGLVVSHFMPVVKGAYDH
ncbi:XRE family transcriptional regulator [Streptococcus pacificus]|uniref:Helix-turn-helix transcriptional regulator n=1 Tax=Streptococcus pacificus TaxID=2740577 RepID=A0ABS0ZJS9_9STRE|nr:XRE family transcriptional regulator [Streptococcus pacificus]MBJ8326217.1 helix-turn-helix transcriptional regulator [Streptococcus pacificus]